MKEITEVTGITVTHNTKELIKNAYESIRKFYPEMLIIIVDGSDPADECRAYVESLTSPYTMLILCQNNIGHGRGMDLALRQVKTKYALVFDSDIVMIKSSVQQMLDMMEPDTYGVGYTEKTDMGGYEWGARPEHAADGFMYMLHPFFHLLQVSEYFKFHPYVHHGAPCFLAARDIHRQGLTDKIIKVLPGLGHTSGKGWCWSPVAPLWVIHNTAGTRNSRRNKGLSETVPDWQRTENGKNSSAGPRPLFK
jgi:GT2 family glycosyltransferase